MLSGGSIDLSALRLAHVIPSKGTARWSVASLGDEVFVSNGQHIEVYDATKFVFQYNLAVPGLGPNCYGLAICLHNNCLYASDYSSIHKVSLSGSNTVKEWSVNQAGGISVNKTHNVVVACSKLHEVQEYTTRGTLVRQIKLQPVQIANPWHAIQLSTGDYVVSHGSSPGGVSIVKIDGQVVHRQSQLNRRQMLNPRCLAVTNDNNIVVAEHTFHAIMSMDSSLSSVQQLAFTVDCGIQNPFGLSLDESRGRLYVSENGGQCRVLVFDSMAVNGGTLAQSQPQMGSQQITNDRYNDYYYDDYYDDYYTQNQPFLRERSLWDQDNI